MRMTVIALMLLGCGGGDAASLFVDFRSDLVPRAELDEVRLTLTGAAEPEQVYVVRTSDTLLEGVRVATYEDLPRGRYSLRAEYTSPLGEVLGIGGPLSVLIGGENEVETLVFTEVCRSVSCPSGTVCNNGECVPPECVGGSSEECAACSEAADCPASAVMCSRRACRAGLCLFEPVPGGCAADEVCSPGSGCIPAVPSDAGRVDAAAPDSGPRDGGSDAAGCTADAQCDDGRFCNGAERCVAASCAPADAPVNCDDGVSCTSDRCDEDTASCVFTVNDDACTVAAGGRCDPAMGCQYPSCTAATCVADPCQTATCEDDVCVRRSACGGGQMCCAGACVAAGCNDGNSCTDDSCGVSGCLNNPNTASCNDGNACTTGDRCSGGSCGGSALSCNDGNLCTNDSCNPASGCQFVNNTAACNDGNACTTTDRCAIGACVGTGALSCNDGNLCTNDSCNPASGCQFVNNTAACDDGNACTVSDTCSAGACAPGGPRSCNDGNECTSNSCDPARGCVTANLGFSTRCGGCEVGHCSSGSCVGGGCSGGTPVCVCTGYCGTSMTACP